ncbi:MAG: hypothetical protein AUJ18_03665 [Candidatus Hydrogenedentes bacterium CG1_02_42_14]|nr:MAG: hypothetical protein AUJ18_03665 [Candidatus Hydrogenedentes bacterium CG1_02_42_14]
MHFSIISHVLWKIGWRQGKKIDKKTQCLGIWYVIIFEIANCKVQIENFIFPICIFQLFHTFFGR